VLASNKGKEARFEFYEKSKKCQDNFYDIRYIRYRFYIKQVYSDLCRYCILLRDAESYLTSLTTDALV